MKTTKTEQDTFNKLMQPTFYEMRNQLNHAMTPRDIVKALHANLWTWKKFKQAASRQGMIHQNRAEAFPTLRFV